MVRIADIPWLSRGLELPFRSWEKPGSLAWQIDTGPLSPSEIPKNRNAFFYPKPLIGIDSSRNHVKECVDGLCKRLAYVGNAVSARFPVCKLPRPDRNASC